MATLTNKFIEKIAAQNAGISTEVIQQDISDTLAEIAIMEEELAGYRLLPDRLSQMRADWRATGITERREFVEKLTAILAYRERLAEKK